MDRDEDTKRLLEEFTRKRKEVAHVYHNLYTIVEYPTTVADVSKPEDGEKGEELWEHPIGAHTGKDNEALLVSAATYQPIQGEIEMAFEEQEVTFSTVLETDPEVGPMKMAGSSSEEIGTSIVENLVKPVERVEEIIGDVNLSQVPPGIEVFQASQEHDDEDMPQITNIIPEELVVKREEGLPDSESENLIEIDSKVCQEYLRLIKQDQEFLEGVTEGVMRGVSDNALQMVQETQATIEELTEVQPEVHGVVSQPIKQAEPENENLIEIDSSSEVAKTQLEAVNEETILARNLLDIEGSVKESFLEPITEEQKREFESSVAKIVNSFIVPMKSEEVIGDEKDETEDSITIEKLVEKLKVDVAKEEENQTEDEAAIVAKVIEPMKIEEPGGDANLNTIEASINPNVTQQGEEEESIGGDLAEIENLEAGEVIEPGIGEGVTEEWNLTKTEEFVTAKVMDPMKAKSIVGEFFAEPEASIVGGGIEKMAGEEISGQEQWHETEDPVVGNIHDKIGKEIITGGEDGKEIEAFVQRAIQETELSVPENLDDNEDFVLEKVIEQTNEEVAAEGNLNEIDDPTVNAVSESIKIEMSFVDENVNAIEPFVVDTRGELEIKDSMVERVLEPFETEEIFGDEHSDGHNGMAVEKVIETIQQEMSVIEDELVNEEIEDDILESTTQDKMDPLTEISEDEIDVTLHLGSYLPEEPIHSFTESEEEVESFGISDRSFIYDGGNDNLGSSGIGNLVFETCGSFLDIGRIPLLEGITNPSDPTPVNYQQISPEVEPVVIEELREVSFQTILGTETVDGAFLEVETVTLSEIAEEELINWDDDSFFDQGGLVMGEDLGRQELDGETSETESSSYLFEEPEIPNIWDSLAAIGIVPGVPEDAIKVLDVPRPDTACQLMNNSHPQLDEIIGFVDRENANSEEQEDGDEAVSELSRVTVEDVKEVVACSPFIPSVNDDSLVEFPVTAQDEPKHEQEKKEFVNHRSALAEIRKLFTRVLINPLRRLFSKGS